jgi:hypothetical protein
MSALPERKMNADEFLAWAEGREGRLELHHGAVVVTHNSTKGQVFRALWSAVERAGAPLSRPRRGARSEGRGWQRLRT